MRAVARLPVRLVTKLLGAFLVIVTLLIALGAAGLEALSNSNALTADLIKSQRKIGAYRQVQHDATSQLYRVSAALFVADEQTLKNALRQLNQFGYDLDRLQFLAGDAELLGRVRADYDRFVSVVTRLIDLIRANKLAEAHELQAREAQPLADSLERLTNRLVNKAEADMVAGIDASEEAYRTGRLIVIGFALTSIALALLLGRTLSASVIDPLHEIGARLGQIASGDFTQQITVPNRDELGVLAADINRTSEQLDRLYADLRTEQQRSEALLLNTLPRPILKRLRDGETVIADRISAATILFSDIVDFTELAGRLPPETMIELLGALFARFDALAGELGLEKIKTLGDGYMAAAGVPEPRSDHAAAAAKMALAMMETAEDVALQLSQPLRLRIGLHSGPLVAGVIGTRKFVYDVWGDTVNTASRMEKLGMPGRVHLSAATRALLGTSFQCVPCGLVEVKGKGPMETYLLEQLRENSAAA